MPAHRKAYLYLTVVVIIWGIAGPVIKYTLDYFDPVLFLTYRFFLSSLMLIPILFIAHPHILSTLNRLTAKDWQMLIIASLLGSTVNLGLLFWGFSLTTSLDGTVINSISPAFVALAGYFILHEHLTIREKLGQVIAVLGTLFILLEPILESGRLFSGNLIGNSLIFLANIAWAGYAVINKKQLRLHLSPLLLTVTMFFFGFVSMSIITLFFSSSYQIITSLTTAPFTAHLGVFYMAAFSGALAYFLFEKGQKSISTSKANIFLYLPPLITTPLAYYWLGEPVTTTFIVGSLIIAGGVIFSETKFHSR